MIELAFDYKAKNSKGKVIAGIVYAGNQALGFSKLKRNGMLPVHLELNWKESVRGLFKKTFDQKDLARFYATLGRRINNDKSVADGLESSIEFVTDERLKQSILIMRQQILDGQPESSAMQSAGFPIRDALVIKSTAQAGETGNTFISLADEIKRVHALRAQVQQIFRMPAIMAVIMYLFFYVAMVKVAPATMTFLKGTNLKLNLTTFNQKYFEAAQWITADSTNFWMGSIVYWSLPLVVFYFVKSKTFKSLLDSIDTIKNISVKADMASLWTSFSLLYNASIPVREACKVISKAARRDDSKIAFERFGKSVTMGVDLSDAVADTQFPDYVKNGVKSAISSGDLVTGLNDMTKNLEEDVLSMTQILQENMKILAILMVAAGVVLIFFFTYFPIVSSVLSNV